MKPLPKLYQTLALVSAVAMLQPVYAYDMLKDPLDALGGISTTPAKNVLGTSCQLEGSPTEPLTLIVAVEWALCNNPQTRLAWVNVKQQADAVGIGMSSYLPTVNLRGAVNKSERNTAFTNDPRYNTDVKSLDLEGGVSLNWVLYDFGLRSANLESARQLLNAANASQDDTLQTVFYNTAQAFYEAQAAQALLSANREAEQSAEKSFKAAEAKYTAGAGTLADMLQAQTSHAQSVSKRVQAEGDLQIAMGSLRVLMGLNSNADVSLSAITEVETDEDLFQQAVEKLIEQAVQAHPKILAAKAQVKAAEAKTDAIRAEGRPKLSLAASADYYNTNATPINNEGSSEQTLNSHRIGLQIDIPLFEGFGRHYKIDQAENQVESKQAELQNAEQQVALDVWKSYQALMTGSENLKASNTLIVSAKQSYDMAQGRYKAGVGTMIELLKAQSDLAGANQQKLQAITRWQTAKIKLATSLGQLGG